MLGTPDEVIAKLKPYEALGVDYFCYCASYHLPIAEQKKSLRLFIDEVLPAFQEAEPVRAVAAAIASIVAVAMDDAGLVGGVELRALVFLTIA